MKKLTLNEILKAYLEVRSDMLRLGAKKENIDLMDRKIESLKFAIQKGEKNI